MTWAEFVAAVEKQLEEKGISTDTRIWWIEVLYPNCTEAYTDEYTGDLVVQDCC